MKALKILGVTIIGAFLFFDLSKTSFGEEKVEYVGVDNCKTCHMPHFESWGETKMSKAFDLLRPGERSEAKKAAGLDPERDYTKEPACLGCHTTGYGQPGGFVNLSSTPEMVGVQCEMCHGPGGRYSKMMYKKRGTYKREDFINAGMTMPSEKDNVCTRKCHNPKSPFVKARYDYKFSYEYRKDIGTHRHDLKYIYMDIELF
jgi:hypothetical protein